MKLSRLRSVILLFGLFFLAIAHNASAADTLPEIDAHRFDIKAIQKSTSGKIYLFESNQVIPKTGNLILVYDHEKPAMAFRVIKNDANKRQFVGKRIRRYDQTGELSINQPYSTLEKIADVLPSPQGENTTATNNENSVSTNPNQLRSNTATPVTNPSQIPGETQVVDTELDSSSKEALDKIDESTEDSGEEEDNNLEVDESTRIDPWNNILTVSAGYFANSSNFVGSSILSNGFSASFAHTLFRDVFINKKNLQDSLGIEFGLIHYSRTYQDGGNDIYTMFPFFADALYQFHLSQTLTLLAYTGLQYNYMSSASNPGASLSLLQGPQLNIGAGMFYNFGPQWMLRLDLGWDRITGGLCIKW